MVDRLQVHGLHSVVVWKDIERSVRQDDVEQRNHPQCKALQRLGHNLVVQPNDRISLVGRNLPDVHHNIFQEWDDDTKWTVACRDLIEEHGDSYRMV